MESFTPLARRLIALGLFVLLILIGFSRVLVPLLDKDRAALSYLADVRRALDRAIVQRDAPQPPEIANFPSDTAFWEKNSRAAHETLAGYVARQAASEGLHVNIRSDAPSKTSAPTIISLEFNVAGSREALFKFIGALETGKPTIRFQRYHLAAAGAGPTAPTASRRLQLDARIVALWGGSK